MTKQTILLSGMIAGDPHQGGATWAVLQYVLGLRRLGHDVYFVEPVTQAALGPWKQNVYLVEPGKEAGCFETSINGDYFLHVAKNFGLENKASLVLVGTRQTLGMPYHHLEQVAQNADLLINISGMLTDAALTEPIRTRVYLDLDPAFNQLWHVAQGIDMRFAGHTHFVTIGLAIGQADCAVPTCARKWITTRQPIVLEHWPKAEPIVHDGLTTVGNWRGYGSITLDGVFYGQKAHSLREFIQLPKLTPEKFMPALAIHHAELKDLNALVDNGWILLDPSDVASTPERYRQFIQGSKAEFGIAKSGYVVSQCGWFSDRSICYLASGRPVIAQETGFSRFLPSGEGLFSFTTCDDVLSAIEAINGDYRRQSRTAWDIAQEYFDSDKVLTRLLQEVGVAS